MPGPARRSRRTRNEPPEIALPKGDDEEHESQDAQTQETMDDENHKEDTEDQNEESDEEGQTHSQEKPRSRKRDESPRKSLVAANTRRSKRVRKPTSRSSSRVSSPALPGTKATKVRGRTTTQSDDQQSKDTDETNSGQVSAVDGASSSSSSSPSSSSEDENEDKSKHLQGTVPRRLPRRSKRARHYPTPGAPSQSEEKVDHDTGDKTEKSRGDESSASSGSERKNSDINNNDNNDDDSSDNEPLSVLMKRKKENLKKMTTAPLVMSSRDSTEGNDHSREAPSKKPLSSAASSTVDDDEDDKESGDDNVKPANDLKAKQRQKRQKRQAATNTNIDTSHRSSGDEHEPPLKKTRGRKTQSSKKSVSDRSTNDELSSDESVAKGGKRSTRSRRRQENAATRPMPSTIQEQDENDDGDEDSTNFDERKITEGKEGSNDSTKPVDRNSIHDDEHTRGKKSSESKRTTRHCSDSHADDEASEEMQETVESSRRSQRKRKRPRKLGVGESSDEDNVVIKEQTVTATETVKEEDLQEVASEPQKIDDGLEHVASQVQLSGHVENANVDTKTLDTEVDTEEQSCARDSNKGATKQNADDNIQLETSVAAETTKVNVDNRGIVVAERDHVIETAGTSEDTNSSIEKQTQIESFSAVTVEGESEDSQGTKSVPEELASDLPTKINPTIENTANVEVSGADLSTQAVTLSAVAKEDSFRQHDKESLDYPEATDSDTKQHLDHKGDAQGVLPPTSLSTPGEHQPQSAEGEKIQEGEKVDDQGRHTASMGEEKPQSSDSLTLKQEESGQTQETAVKLEKDVVIVTDDTELGGQSVNLSSENKSLSTQVRDTEQEASSLRNGEENEHINEREAVDHSDESKSRAGANKDMDSLVTGISEGDKDIHDNDLRSTVDESAVLTDEAIKGLNVDSIEREATEPTPENKEKATQTSKKDEDEENDHFHDAQMELPPEPSISLNHYPTQGEILEKPLSQGEQTVVEESRHEKSESTAEVATGTKNETGDEAKQVAHSNLSMLETTTITEGLPKEQQGDEIATPLVTAVVPLAISEIGASAIPPSLPLCASPMDDTNSVVGKDFNTVPNQEMIDAEPQITQAMSLQEMAGFQDSGVIPSGDGIEISSMMPTNDPGQINDKAQRAQDGAVGTSDSLLQPKPISTGSENVNDESKMSEKATPTQNPLKDPSTAATESSEQDMSPKSVTNSQAADETKDGPSKPISASDLNEPQLLTNLHGMEGSAPMASPASLIVEDLQVETHGFTSEVNVPAIQSRTTEVDPHFASDTKKAPELWALPLDLDYKVKFGPTVPPISKLPNKNRRNIVDSCDGDKIKRIKAALFAAGSKAHRGSGFERVFAEYWDAMALRLSDRLSSHTSERCQKAIDNFLTTSKLRKLHNKFVMSILRRATKSVVVYDEISSHLPSKWRNRISIICDKMSDNSAQHSAELWDASGSLANCAYEPMEPVYREAWHQDQPDPKPIGNESRRQKAVTGPKHEVASSSIPGALTVDPLVRKIAEECDMQVSELAVWMMVVAVREHATNILRAALSQKEGMEQQELVPRTLRFPNFLANATKPPPKKDSIQELGKPSTAEKAARAQRKLTVLDVYAGSSTMPCGNVGSLGGSLSRDVLERSLHAAFDHLPVVPKDDFVQVQHFITEQIFGEARTRKVPTKPRDDERDTRADDSNRNVNVAKQRNSFSVPAPAPAQARQPQVESQTQVKTEAPLQAPAIAVKEPTPQQDPVTPTADASIEDDAGLKSLPRGMGRGAKDLAALMRRTSTSTSPVQENILKENEGKAGGDEASPEETMALDSSHAPPLEEPGVDGEDPMGQRRGKGFGIKNLAAMRARASNNDSQPSTNVS